MVVISAWILAGMTLAAAGPGADAPAARAVFHELRPLYLPAVAVFCVSGVLSSGDLPLMALAAATQVWSWFLLKDRGGDDDRWKRRRKRAAEKISQVGSRLVVAPAPTGGA